MSTDELTSLRARVLMLEGALIEARTELFALCEATDDECLAAIKGLKGIDDTPPENVHALAFNRGRRHEAKGISRAMGEVFRAALQGLSQDQGREGYGVSVAESGGSPPAAAKSDGPRFAGHEPSCPISRAATCAVGIECEHGFDVCPECDRCTCGPFQARILPWMLECFGPVIPFDKEERGDRLLEETFELLQSGGYDPRRVLALRDYVWGRDVGEPFQEVGGVMVTLGAYCIAHELDMAVAGETELARIWTKVEAIRAKQAAKPTGSALPIAINPADHRLSVARSAAGNIPPDDPPSSLPQQHGGAE